MVTTKPKVAIVGYGKVGKVLGRALPAAGYNLIAVVTRQSSIDNLQSTIYNSISDLPLETDLVILCLRDRDIQSAASALPDNPKSKIQNPKFLCHTAGALSAEILAPASAKGWRVMAWHPMQTFTGDEGLELLKSVTFGIDGDEDAAELGERMARDLGGVPFRVPPELRGQYHIAAVFACNLLIALAGEALDLLRGVGMDEARALTAIKPLMQATIGNLSRRGLMNSITGPVGRRDAETLRMHLATLAPHPGSEEIYRLLSLRLLERLPEDAQSGALRYVLHEGHSTGNR